MGHYDSCYEFDFEERQRQNRERAEKTIPEVIKFLEDARVKLYHNTSVIDHSDRIMADIQFIQSALKGQLVK